MLNEFTQEKECQYKGETYSVRDNGSVLRHSRHGMKPRPSDDKWTFGKYSKKTGYAEIAGERVHRIVATAFIGPAPTMQHVVDHIDTNRRNNRPENLRWVTKLENIILNPITCKKIAMLCGSVEAFLADPSILRNQYVDRDFEWMRAVTKEEGAATLERMRGWAESDKEFSGGTLGEWVYRRNTRRKLFEIGQSFLDQEKGVDGKESESVKTTITTKSQKPDRTNPFNFPRSSDVTLYRTAGEIFEILIARLKKCKTLKLPDIVLETSGKGFLIKESWDEEILDIEYTTEGRSRIPKSINIHGQENTIALIVNRKSSTHSNEINRLKDNGFNILELDLSWAKNGVTDLEIDYILQTDLSNKEWLNHSMIQDADEKISMICEPISGAGHGVFHSYIACPQYSNSIQDIECWYCDYRLIKEMTFDGEKYPCACCFYKSGVRTYNDLLSIVDVQREDEKIISITYNKGGKLITRKFDKDVKLPGDTIFNLWEKKKSDYIVVHNIYSDWYVFIEEDPKACHERTGQVYGRLARTTDNIENAVVRSIFSYDDYCWEMI